jgi:hypothetical protein
VTYSEEKEQHLSEALARGNVTAQFIVVLRNHLDIISRQQYKLPESNGNLTQHQGQLLPRTMSFTDPWKAGTPDIPPSAATFTTYASTRINAPASLVFRTLRNTDTWRDWNRFVPRVTITFQPPDKDKVTQAEISELVRNTSIAGSVDSDITDGAAAGTRGLTGRRMSLEEEDEVRLAPPPVTRVA